MLLYVLCIKLNVEGWKYGKQDVKVIVAVRLDGFLMTRVLCVCRAVGYVVIDVALGCAQGKTGSVTKIEKWFYCNYNKSENYQKKREINMKKKNKIVYNYVKDENKKLNKYSKLTLLCFFSHNN